MRLRLPHYQRQPSLSLPVDECIVHRLAIVLNHDPQVVLQFLYVTPQAYAAGARVGTRVFRGSGHELRSQYSSRRYGLLFSTMFR